MTSDQDSFHQLQSGVYQVFNSISGTVIDLAAPDFKWTIGFPAHDGQNQLWDFTPLGRGYSIRSQHNGHYLTIEEGLHDGARIVASPYPVSWALEADDIEKGIWRITWPNSPFVFDLAGRGSSEPGAAVQLGARYPFECCRLWRLVRSKATSDWGEDLSTPPAAALEMPAVESPVTSTADTVINAEGLKLGGNGELVVTTTTTTTTTTVTKIMKLNRSY